MAEYYDQEGAQKCTKVSEAHEKFYTDLKERVSKGDQAYTSYAEKRDALHQKFQEKITHHKEKFSSD